MIPDYGETIGFEGVPYLDDALGDVQTGQVTALLRNGLKLSNVSEAALYDAIVDQLRAKACAILQKFPRFQGLVAPDDLVNEFHARFLEKTLFEDLTDRVHFLALGCQHFRWILLDMLKQKTNQTLLIDANIAGDAGPATRSAISIDAEVLFDRIKQLAMPDSQIVEFHCVYELTFTEIGELLRIHPKTVQSRFHAAMKKIRQGLQS